MIGAPPVTSEVPVDEVGLLVETLAAERNAAIAAVAALGEASYAEIGRRHGISRQRIGANAAAGSSHQVVTEKRLPSYSLVVSVR